MTAGWQHLLAFAATSSGCSVLHLPRDTDSAYSSCSRRTVWMPPSTCSMGDTKECSGCRQEHFLVPPMQEKRDLHSCMCIICKMMPDKPSAAPALHLCAVWPLPPACAVLPAAARMTPHASATLPALSRSPLHGQM